jgi:hypothetical protein
MAQISQEELDERLNKNGWAWHLISNTTPGIIRIQLGSDGEEEDGWRKCIEAPTPEQALNEAERFINSISTSEYSDSLEEEPPLWYIEPQKWWTHPLVFEWCFDCPCPYLWLGWWCLTWDCDDPWWKPHISFQPD